MHFDTIFRKRKDIHTKKIIVFLGLFNFIFFLIERVGSDWNKLLIFILPCQRSFSGFCSSRCTCTAGWTGPDCSEDINECESEPCLNGATCFESVKPGQFVCICPPFYTGDFCHQRFSPCELPYNPCINNSTCLAQVDGNPVCICKTGEYWNS